MRLIRKPILLSLVFLAAISGGAIQAPLVNCGPFADVSPGFCPFVLELYYLGITAGTSATTFSPDQPITRGQAAVFVSKAIDTSIQRSSRRAPLGQWWTTVPHYSDGLGVTNVGSVLRDVKSDGVDLWVASYAEGLVYRVRASDGRILETWSSEPTGTVIGILVAMGRVFVAGQTIRGGGLYVLDPSQPPGPMTIVADNLPTNASALTFDGARIWFVSSGFAGPGAITIITPGPTLPWSVTIAPTTVFQPAGILFDGSNVWAIDGTGAKKLDSNGNLLQTVTFPGGAVTPVFDGRNIWIPSQQGQLTVVSTATGAIVATLSGNGMTSSVAAGFDGERVLIVNALGVSLWKAADFSSLGDVPTGILAEFPAGVCSDGKDFWILLRGVPSMLARF